MVPLRVNLGSALGFAEPFGSYVGTLFGHSGLCWALVGSFGALLAAFRTKISTPTEAWFRWDCILGFGL